MKISHLALCTLVALASCAAIANPPSKDGSPATFELGAAEFLDDDLIVVEQVLSSSGQITAGATLTVRGKYALGSREAAWLYLGVTATTSDGATTKVGPHQRSEVPLGEGDFELRLVVPGPGYPHVTFYDVATGKPFGGLYFGSGDSLLRTQAWTNAR